MTRSLFRFYLPVLILLAGGVLLAESLITRVARETRADMVQRVQMLAQGMNLDNLKALSGTEADVRRPEYRRLKQDLTVVRAAYPECRFIYLTGRKADGTVFFFVDSEPAESKDISPPGQPYTEVSPEFRRVFDTKRATTEGPVSDRWGVWVSALTPITDPQSGEVLAVLGMDVDAHNWRWMLARAALPAVLLTLALVAVWVLGAVLLDRRSVLGGTAPRWMRHLEPGLVVAVGLTLSLAAAWLALTNASRHDAELFENLASQQAQTIVERLQNVRDLQLEGLGRFYSAREHISTGEFQEFARSLTRNVSVTTWGWIPVVSAADRERFEAAARADGMPGFEIWEPDATGKRIRAASRKVYYPVFQVAPPVRLERVAGNDSGAEPRRRAALEETMATGLTTGTEPITLSSETGQQKGLLIYRPVYSRDGLRRLRGFVGAAVRMENLLRAGTPPDRMPLMELQLLRPNTAPESLATTWDPAHPPAAGLSVNRPLFAFGKAFIVTVRAGPEFGREGPLRAGGIALLTGLMLTGTLTVTTRLIFRRREKLEQLVVERTSELRLSEQSYRNQFAESSAVMLLIEPESGAIIDANEAALAFYGHPRERILDMRISEINIKGAAELTQITESVMQRRRNRFEFRHRLADGSIRDVAVASSAIQYGGRTILHSIIQDITDQKRAQEKLQQLSSIIEQAPLSIIIADLAGVIEYVNPKYCELSGFSREEMIGRAVRTLRSAETPPEVYSDLWSTVTDGRVWNGEFYSLKKNGQSYLENVVAAPLVGEGGRTTHIVTVKDDISAQKRAEAELAKERELSQMKSQFISVASHEFRTPLAAAVGSLELLERHAGRLSEAKRAELITRIKASLNRLTTIMDDVLQLSRANSGRVIVKRTMVDLVQVVQDLIHEVETGDRQKHLFAFQHSGRGDAVPVDTNLVGHIISNLLGNAVRYSPEGTTISVALEICTAAFSLTVADEGIGIPEAERDRVFEPFARGSNVGQIKGTGLGLNIVKRYTELMRGHIELLPTERGAAFHVNIPLPPPEASP